MELAEKIELLKGFRVGIDQFIENYRDQRDWLAERRLIVKTIVEDARCFHTAPVKHANSANIDPSADPFALMFMGAYREAVEYVRDMVSSTIGALLLEQDQATRSDVVQVNQDAAQVQEISEKLEALEKAVRETNEFGDNSPEDRARIVAELAAGRELIKAPKVRLSAVKTVIMQCLGWLAKHFAEAAIGVLATALMALVAAYFGVPVPG